MSVSKIQYFQNFEYEIKINIFKYVNSPLNLTLTCRNWSVIIKDPYSKAEWLIIRHGKAHALFHAIRLGPTFIDVPVCRTLITRKVMVSTCLVQKLLVHLGKYEVLSFQQTLWTSNLPITIFTYLLDESYKQLSNADLPLKGNDMESFHFLSAV